MPNFHEKKGRARLLRLLKIHRMQGTIKNIFSIYYLVKKKILRKKLLLKKNIISLSKSILKIFENIYIFFCILVRKIIKFQNYKFKINLSKFKKIIVCIYIK